MALEYGTIDDFMDKYGNNMVAETINQEAKVFSEIPQFDLGGDGGLDIFNVDTAFGNVANQDDGGALIDGGNVTPIQGFVRGSIKRSAIQIPRATAEVVQSARQGLDMLERQIKGAGRSLARAYGRGVIAEKLVTLSAADVLVDGTGIFAGTTGDATLGRSNTTGVLHDISGLRAGDIVARYSSNGTLREILKITRAQLDVDGNAHTITAARDQHALLGVSAPTNANPAAGDYLQLYTPSSAVAITDLQTLAGTSNVYGISTAPHFVGNSQDMGGAFDELDLRQLHVATMFHGDGSPAAFVASNARNRQRYQEQAVGRLNFMKDDVLDVSGGKLEVEFDGRPWIVDHLVPDDEIYLLPKDKDKLSFRWFRRPKADTVGAEKGGRMSGFVKSASVFAYDNDAWGMGALRCPGRTCIGLLNGITS